MRCGVSEHGIDSCGQLAMGEAKVQVELRESTIEIDSDTAKKDRLKNFGQGIYWLRHKRTRHLKT